MGTGEEHRGALAEVEARIDELLGLGVEYLWLFHGLRTSIPEEQQAEAHNRNLCVHNGLRDQLDQQAPVAPDKKSSVDS